MLRKNNHTQHNDLGEPKKKTRGCHYCRPNRQRVVIIGRSRMAMPIGGVVIFLGPCSFFFLIELLNGVGRYFLENDYTTMLPFLIQMLDGAIIFRNGSIKQDN